MSGVKLVKWYYIISNLIAKFDFDEGIRQFRGSIHDGQMASA